ncbi:jg27300 [Pararge aegeria aegeria]|uniref:Jg27300 protein n=1 Tax=Pararge aegeria aegeria TaxID=348720 RepID=A0A8S4SJM2_9NEOP|nr:jg27300 [Pararge aegeria aegeria]
MSEFYHIINVFKHRDPYNALCPYPITETYNIYCDLTNANQDPQDDDGWELKDMAEWNFDESVAWIYHCAATREFSVFDIPLHNFRLPGVDLRNKRCKDIVNLMVKPNVDFEVSRRIAHTIFDMLQCRLEVERARFVNPDKVAKLWGEKKQNKHMNFPKFSRAMRYHYLNDVLARCSERLVYRFGSNAPDYKTNNPYLLNATPKFIGP